MRKARRQLNPSIVSCLYDPHFNSRSLFSCRWTTGSATFAHKCRNSHFTCTGQRGCTEVNAYCRINRINAYVKCLCKMRSVFQVIRRLLTTFTLLTNSMDRLKPESKKQCSVMINLMILHEFNPSHHQEAKKDKKDKVNCEIIKIQHCTR